MDKPIEEVKVVAIPRTMEAKTENMVILIPDNAIKVICSIYHCYIERDFSCRSRVLSKTLRIILACSFAKIPLALLI